jgi:hypothetical protein
VSAPVGAEASNVPEAAMVIKDARAEPYSMSPNKATVAPRRISPLTFTALRIGVVVIDETLTISVPARRSIV